MNYKEIDWNTASKLGIITRINKEVLHPLGLAMTRNPSTGSSDSLLIAPDGFWEYSPDAIVGTMTDAEISEYLKEIA